MGISFEISGGKRLDEVLVICCVLNKKKREQKKTKQKKSRVAWIGLLSIYRMNKKSMHVVIKLVI